MLDSRRWWWVLLACLLSKGAWAGESLIGIRLGLQPEATRIVLDLSGPIPYRIGLLASPDRLYIELPPCTVPAVLPTGRGLVRSLALSQESGLVRLVVNLAGPVTLMRADLIPGTGDALSRRLVVDVHSATGTEFADALSAGPVDSDPPIVLDGSGATEAGTPAVASPAAEPQPSLVASEPLVLPLLRPDVAPTAFDGALQPTPASATVSTVAKGTALQVATAAFVWPSAVPMLKPGNAAPAAKPLIYIDPGHGGPDPGTIGQDGVYEKDITMATAKELERQLLASGHYRVKLTRETDRFVALRARFEMARQDHADLFISIHVDSNPFEDARGATVYTLSETASDAEAGALAAKENKADLIDGVDLSQQNNTVTSILIDLAQRETKNRSAAFAELLVHDLGQITLMQLNSHRYAGFAVLKAPDIPSVLIELGYLSDAQDEALLISPQHRAKLAAAMLHAVDGYYAEMASGTRS
jgi:N-acetylmuramoyl-L-alanine amidase